MKRLSSFLDLLARFCVFVFKLYHKKSLTILRITSPAIIRPATGGTKEKPVGLMYSTIYTDKKFKNYKIQVDPNLSRESIKEQFTQRVLENILEFLKEL